MFQLLKTSFVEQAATLYCCLSSNSLIFSSVTSNLLLIPSEIKQKKTGGGDKRRTVSFRTTVITLIMYEWHPQMGREREQGKNIGRNYNNGIKFPKFDENYKTYIDRSGAGQL